MNSLEIVREECAQMAENKVPLLSRNATTFDRKDVEFLLSRLKANIAEDIRAITLPEIGVSESIIEENKTLRTMLCLTGSALPYMDDGEMQDNSTFPYIDYKRDSSEEIKNKLSKRAENAIVNDNLTVGISLQDEYDILKAQLEMALKSIREHEQMYLSIDSSLRTQINALKKENEHLKRLPTLSNVIESSLLKREQLVEKVGAANISATLNTCVESESTRESLIASLEKVHKANMHINPVRISDLEQLVLTLTEAVLYSLNKIGDKSWN